MIAHSTVVDPSGSSPSIEASYPLSPMQQGMLLHALNDPRAGVDIEQMIITLDEEVDSERLKQAWLHIIRRHTVLRTCFRLDSSGPTQVVLSAVVPEWRDLDLSGLASIDCDAYLERLLCADRQRGFDMTLAPLMRFCLIRTHRQSYRLVWSFHHSILDGRAFVMVVQEVFALYKTVDTGPTTEAPTPRPYRDFIAWLTRQDFTLAQPYWDAALAGLDSPTLLADTLGRRANHAAALDAFVERRLSRHLTNDLCRLARQRDWTPNTLFQAAWAILLGRYLGTADPIFGVTRACRKSAMSGADDGAIRGADHSAMNCADDIVGLLINTLPLRVPLDPKCPVSSLVTTIRRAKLDVRPFEHTPLAQIQSRCGASMRSGLFDTLVVFENFEINAVLQSQDPAWRNRHIELREKTNYPLTVSAYLGAELRIRAAFHGTHFDEPTVTRLLTHLENLLTSIVADPETPVEALQMLSPQERIALLADWNVTSSHYPERAVHRLFEEQAARTPDAIALASGQDILTFAQLNGRANQLARYLQSRGALSHRAIGLCLPRGLDMVIALLATLKVGAAYAPLDPTYPPDRLAYMLRDVRADVVLTIDELGPRLPDAVENPLYIDRLAGEIAAMSDADLTTQVHPDDLCYILYTSGSTGAPKGVAIPHRAVVRLVLGADYARFEPDEVFLQLAPISFDASTFEIWGSLLHGARLVIPPPGALALDELAAIIERQGITTLWLTAGLFHQMVDAQPDALRGLGQLLAGGDVLSVDHVRRLLQGAGTCRLINGYGPTESTTFTCCYTVPRLPDGATSVPIGFPIANTQVYVLDPRLDPTPIGLPGELYIGGDGLALGYLNRPELTAERFVPDPFSGNAGARLYRTGDRVRRNPDGSIDFLGRLDRQVKVRGFRIEVEEVEAALLQFDHVHQAVVMAREDAPGLKRLVAYLVADLDGKLNLHELQLAMKRRLPDYMVPTAFVTLQELPLTANGKVDRSALPAPDSFPTTGPSDSVAPRTEREKVMAEIWADVLRVPTVGINDDFFALGGDSILSLQIVSRARRSGINIRPNQVFEHPSITELLAAAQGHSIPTVQRAVHGPIALTPILHWFFERDLIDPQHFNQFVCLTPHRPIHATILRQAITALMQHHDMLRLRCRQTDTGWQLLVTPSEERDVLLWIDGSGWNAEERRDLIDETVRAQQSRLDLEHGPLARFIFFDCGAVAPSELWILCHHLCIDGVSWRILCEDLDTAYTQLIDSGHVALPTKTTSFQEWTGRLEAFAGSDVADRSRDFWQAQHSTNRLPIDLDVTPNTVATLRTVTVTLDIESTDSLLRVLPTASGPRAADALIAALAITLARWLQSNSICLHLEGHGRESLFDDIDLSRTIGWFTSIYPVRLTVDLDASPDSQLAAIHTQLNGVPDRGVSYGILRYLGNDAELQSRLSELPQPEISFNFLGQFDQTPSERSVFGLAGSTIGLACSARQQRAHLIEIDGYVLNNQLTLQWGFAETVHHSETIEHLANEMLHVLKRLLHNPQVADTIDYRDPDFPDLRLSREDLDHILSELDF